MKKSMLPAALLCVLFITTGFHVCTVAQVRHIVFFKYKSTATQAQIGEITAAFKALKEKIPGIVSFENGTNNSPENLNKGFTHVYMVTFKDVASRDAYLPHAEHKKFVEMLGKMGVLDEPFVVDFEVGK